MKGSSAPSITALILPVAESAESRLLLFLMVSSLKPMLLAHITMVKKAVVAAVAVTVTMF